MTLVPGPDEPAAGPWRVAPIEDVVQRLLAGAGDPVGRPHLVAVDGRSGGGKTTAATALGRASPASAVVHTDDVAWHHSFFGWAELMIGGVLEPLHRGEAVSYRPPPWEERSREGAIDVPAGLDVVWIEGVGAGRRELVPWLDAVVWVQSDFAEAERRGIARDGGGEAATAFWHEWMAEELPFQSAHRPWQRADLIVAGTPEPAHDPTHQIVVATRPG